MTDLPRLIEHAFPLKQASLDSVHEKNVRHGHISTLHIWPARRPLAACRAALIATLLPDPSAEPKPDGMSDEDWHKEIIRRRQELCEKIGGKIVKRIEKKRMPNGQVVEREKEETEGGILHWGRETENKELLEWFRKKIQKAYGGRAPKVLDPFAGGGAIPLEAMRLGCEATALDINPVAWFILKCTLEYPQKLAGKTWPLPGFILQNEAFMREFLEKAKGLSKGQITKALERSGCTLKKGEQAALDLDDGQEVTTEADLAWHVRAWGQWVLERARRDLAKYYPTYADFEPLEKHAPRAYERQPMCLVPSKEDGTSDVDALNAEFSEEYLAGKRNPRWVVKPTVAYLWARTVTCKNCRATIPLLKTCWLSKKPAKRVLVVPAAAEDGTITFTLRHNAPVLGGNAAQKREHDRRVGLGTMSKSGARCLHCPTIHTHEDIQVAALSGRWSSVLAAVVVDGVNGKEFREATEDEKKAYSLVSTRRVEPLRGAISPVRPSPNARGLSGLTRYGIDNFGKVFNERQAATLQIFSEAVTNARQAIETHYDGEMMRAVTSYLAASVDRLTDRNSTLCHWNKDYEKITGTFQRYALRVNWDYAEVNPFSVTTGNYSDAVEWIARFLDHALLVPCHRSSVTVAHGSAMRLPLADKIAEIILTDPPYYDAIPYSDLSDYYYVWLRRSLGEMFPEQFASEVTLKDNDIIQHAALAGGNNRAAKQRYEDGMASAFSEAHRCLADDSRFVVVFAHKQPDAWETLVSAIIRAGFTVDASWPIQTEMPHKAAGGARLASSVWLVCKKRPADARPGWDNQVLEEMRRNIREKLHAFWDAGIRGPDFVWAATGPALEAYSKHPIVKKADDPGQVMTVSEFLTHVRRMVVDFVVGRVMYGEDDTATRRRGDAGIVTVSPGHRVAASQAESPIGDLDEPTAYYLLHRHDFGMDEAPAGACILYAISCGISDKALAGTWDLIAFTKGKAAEDEEDAEMGGRGDAEMADEEAESDAEEDSGNKVKLKTWAQRKGSSLGYEAPNGKPIPLIDRVHCLMHLWKAGDLHKVDEYLDGNGLRRQELFKRLLQSLIELSPHGSEERSLLESISNHVQAKGAVDDRQLAMPQGG